MFVVPLQPVPLTDTKFTLDGKSSVSTTSSAASGPLFVTSTVYVRFSPRFTFDESALIITSKSASSLAGGGGGGGVDADSTTTLVLALLFAILVSASSGQHGKTSGGLHRVQLPPQRLR